MTPSFWKGRQVFVTGHTGFKGAWLCLWLQSLGARVSGYSLDPVTQPSLFDQADVARGLEASIRADVRDLGALKAALRSAQPQILFHMAAQSLVRESYADPVGTYATNVMGTVNLLEAARETPSAKAVVIVTSDKCYENRERDRGYREDEAMGGHDPYSSSKGCAELVAAAYRRSFFSGDSATTAVASARAGNVIGGGDWSKDRLVPDAMSSFIRGGKVRIRNPRAVRPWQHVLDPLSGYLTLAERLAEKGRSAAEAWNFGPGDEDMKPVQWVVDELARRWGRGAGWEADTAAHPHEAGILKLDCSKARDGLSWRPRLPLAKALDWTVEWFSAHHGGQAARALTEDQIRRYQSEAAR
jgi:CDP-glucose 4,6-dehydratase